jgi:hypothetical protein
LLPQYRNFEKYFPPEKTDISKTGLKAFQILLSFEGPVSLEISAERSHMLGLECVSGSNSSSSSISSTPAKHHDA